MSAASTGTEPVRAVAQRVVRLVNEVAAGARPARLVTPLFIAHLRGAVRRARPDHGGVARIRRLVIASHREGVYEIVAVCSRADRVSALGLQLTCCSDGRWQVTDMAHPQFRARRPADRLVEPGSAKRNPRRSTEIVPLLSNPPSVAAPR